jgi:predicted Zn-dependent protease
MRFSRRAINGLSRREFLIMTSVAATGLAVGCATNPVTGKSQFMIMDEQQEIAVDRQQSPHQFSADYGTTQDRALQSYVQTTGKRLARNTHRGQMPYNFRCVNANYVNAYAFPGGSIACTRGILLELDNEAELAALLGHELGHVNARHTAEIMSKAQLANMAVGGLTILTSVAVGSGAGSLAGQLGQLGSGALLATYSRDNERQADDLGMVYMTRSGYGPQGMVGLMEMLNNMNRHPAGMTDLLFATHPMSSERYQTSVYQATNNFRQYNGQPLYKERYMDSTAGLRKIKGAIKKMQDGEAAMGKEQFSQAEGLFNQALEKRPMTTRDCCSWPSVSWFRKKTARRSAMPTGPSRSIPMKPRLITSAVSLRSATRSTTRPTRIFPFTSSVFRATPIRFSFEGSLWRACRKSIRQRRPTTTI